MIRRATLFTASIALCCTSFALDMALEPYAETCSSSNGKVYAYAFGGTAPYTFAWTGPNGFTAATDSIYGLGAGLYEVTVTDALLESVVRTAVIENMLNLPTGGGGTYAGASQLTGFWGGACEGECNGVMAMVEINGTPPFSYSFSVNSQFLGNTSVGDPVYGGFCLGDNVNYMYTDAFGCQGDGSFTVIGVDATWYPTISNIMGSCTGTAGGSVEISGGAQGFTSTHEVWSNGQFVASQPGFWGAQVVIDELPTGDHELRTTWDPTQCSDVQLFTIPDLGTNCGSLSGSSWYDVDGDCILDPNEVGIPNSILAIEPGGIYALTRNDGSFYLDLPDGNYTLSRSDPTLVPICPATEPVPFSMNGTPVNIELANGSTQELDLQVWGNSSAARPGFDHFLYARATNLSPQQSGPVTLSITYDPALTYLSATPTPTSVVGNVITWEWPAFGSFEDQFVNAHFNLPAGVPIGTVLNSSFTASNTLPEAELTNNTVLHDRTVTGSYDPNDKTATTSSRESDELYFINSDAYIDYTIRFQNTGTDTAFTVVITDTLSADYDMSSFQPGVCSHPCTVDFKAGRVVEWSFTDILLPDSNANEAASHGLTSFRIKLNEPVLPGTEIENVANIYFDFNEPVITEPSVLVAEFSTGVQAQDAKPNLFLMPNPTSGLLEVRVSESNAANGILQVVAVDGRVVLQQRMEGLRTVLDVANLTSGLYTLNWHAVKGTVTTQRFVRE